MKNAAEVDQMLPFKKDVPSPDHSDVGNIPSVQDSSTGIRHTPEILGNLLGTKAEGMNV